LEKIENYLVKCVMAKKKLSKKVVVKYYKKYHRSIKKWFLISVSSLVGLLLVSFSIYSVSFASEAYNNVFLGEINFEGKNREEIIQILNEKSDELIKNQIELEYSSEESEIKKYDITPEEIGITYDIEATADKVISYGRNNSAWKDLWNQLRTIFAKTVFVAEYQINSESLSQKIEEMASELDQPEQDFELEYNGEKFELSAERRAGNRIDQEELAKRVEENIANIINRIIVFESKHYSPQITEENANKTLKGANRILASGDLVLTYKGTQHLLGVDDLAALILSKPMGDELMILVDKERAKKQIEVLAGSINQEPKNAELKMSGGKVSVFQNSLEGRAVDVEKSVLNLENAIMARISEGVNATDTKTAQIVVSENSPEITSEEIESYGLKEMVASGTTSFYGSSSNRKHNIANGASAISGTLLEPSEEFSTLETLGAIDASTGYLEELVILENRTVPEFGGGLCQVSTTLFRSALNAGMEIIERKNHKYRVSYYEPPVGMDATIYDPAPDFRFKNNYNSYILIQSKIVGTKLTFEFYGTKDARVISIGTPEEFDIVQPGPPVLIETEGMQPGEKERVERAHPGLSAKFHYKVERDGEILQEKDFNSKYVAWPEKWLVGPRDPDAPPINDNDRDGVVNEDDNCMDIGNPDQVDGDGDGIGDACQS